MPEPKCWYPFDSAVLFSYTIWDATLYMFVIFFLDYLLLFKSCLKNAYRLWLSEIFGNVRQRPVGINEKRTWADMSITRPVCCGQASSNNSEVSVPSFSGRPTFKHLSQTPSANSQLSNKYSPIHFRPLRETKGGVKRKKWHFDGCPIPLKLKMLFFGFNLRGKEPFPFPVIRRFCVSSFLPPHSSLPHFRLVIQSLIKCQRTACCPRVLAPSASWNTYLWWDRSPSGPVEGVSTFIQNPDETT